MKEKKVRKTWVGYKPLRTPTKKEKLKKIENKHKGDRYGI